ncbi:patatin-like phospholipase family protein [Candidatus Dojkabacteria bacterium]|nr:patatin-like phospholipase family protein [Candidatus Dojkabacteria bacterium]
MKLFGRSKIGLALGGGGARGLAHLGVIKVLERNKIPIDFIAGTSAGALIGGMYAAKKNVRELEELAQNVSYKDYLRAFSDPSLVSGLFKGGKAINFIKEQVGKINVEDTKIPFRAVAADVVTGETVYIDTGNLAEAIRTSCSVPGVFSPFKKRKRFLIDGGVVEQVPVKAVKDMGAQRVIAVSLNWKHFPPKDKEGKDDKLPVSSIVSAALDIMGYNIAKYNIKEAEIVIEPRVPDVPMFKFLGETRIIEIGEKAAVDKIEEIKWMIKKTILGIPYS